MLENSNVVKVATETPTKSNPSEEQAILQVRELLFGQARRELSGRLDYMSDRMNDMESSLRRQIGAMSEELKASEARSDKRHRASLMEMSILVERLSDEIKRLAEE